jgi:hypothetical protein
MDLLSSQLRCMWAWHYLLGTEGCVSFEVGLKGLAGRVKSEVVRLWQWCEMLQLRQVVALARCTDAGALLCISIGVQLLCVDQSTH